MAGLKFLTNLLQAPAMQICRYAHMGDRTAAIGKWDLSWDWLIPEGKRALLEGTEKKDVRARAAQKALWEELFFGTHSRHATPR